MQLQKDLKIIDLALYLKDKKTLIIADTHIGLEEAMNKQGLLVPRFQFSELIKRLGKIFKKINVTKENKLSKIVINGDVKHEFGKISETEWRNTLKLLDFLSDFCNELILVKGNHDTILGPIAEKRKLKIKEFEKINDILITHGEKIKKDELKNINTIIIGHEHPAISITNNLRTEIYKCFLKGSFKGKILIVQPSFNLVSEGTNILNEKLLSPFLKNIKDFDVYIVEDKVYYFSKVKEIIKAAETSPL